MMTEAEILTRVDRLTEDRLTVCIARSWVRPLASGEGFTETDLARLRLIVELTEDLAVNDEAVPVILNLIDEVSGLRRRMRVFDHALASAPDLRARVLERLNALGDTGAETGA